MAAIEGPVFVVLVPDCLPTGSVDRYGASPPLELFGPFESVEDATLRAEIRGYGREVQGDTDREFRIVRAQPPDVFADSEMVAIHCELVEANGDKESRSVIWERQRREARDREILLQVREEDRERDKRAWHAELHGLETGAPHGNPSNEGAA